MNAHTRHECGGTELLDSTQNDWYIYCDTCRAFTYDLSQVDAKLPTGADITLNSEAWDNGDEEALDRYSTLGDAWMALRP